MTPSGRSLKKPVRRAFLERRLRQPAWLCSWKSRRIASRVRGLSPFKLGNVILAYVPVRGEADPRGVINTALRQGKVLALPRVARKGRLEFYRVSGMEGLIRGAFGIPEPVPAPGGKVAVSRADLILVPGAAFSLTGHRLGYGGGFYDSALVSRKGAAIGIGFEFQLAARLPVEKRDVPLDGLVTEKRVLLFRDPGM